MKKTTLAVIFTVAVVLAGIVIAIIGVTSNNGGTASVDTTDIETTLTDNTESSDTESSSSEPIETESTDEDSSETTTDETDPVHTHEWGEWEVVKTADCSRSGLKERVCACGESEQEQISALGHTYVIDYEEEPTCTEQGYTVYICSACNDSYRSNIQVAKGHAYSDWITVTEPTCESRGYSERKCEACGTHQTKELDAYGHQYEPALNEDNETVYQCTLCLVIIEASEDDPIHEVWEEQHVIPMFP